MKVRHGFVSNSSSSSFLVMLPRDMKITKENINKELFGTAVGLTFDSYGDGNLSQDSVVDIVVEDMLNKGQASPDDLAQMLPDVPQTELVEILDPMPTVDRKYERDNVSPRQLTEEERRERLNYFNHYYEQLEEWQRRKAKQWLAHNPDIKVYVLEYSDNDGGTQTIMEHGGVFDDMKRRGRCVIRSNH